MNNEKLVYNNLRKIKLLHKYIILYFILLVSSVGTIAWLLLFYDKDLQNKKPL
jgi:hypothetical protein